MEISGKDLYEFSRGVFKSNLTTTDSLNTLMDIVAEITISNPNKIHEISTIKQALIDEFESQKLQTIKSIDSELLKFQRLSAADIECLNCGYLGRMGWIEDRKSFLGLMVKRRRWCPSCKQEIILSDISGSYNCGYINNPHRRA